LAVVTSASSAAKQVRKINGLLHQRDKAPMQVPLRCAVLPLVKILNLLFYLILNKFADYQTALTLKSPSPFFLN